MYDKFKQYINYSHGPCRFFELNDSDICDAENRLGFCFPVELRRFYYEIGYGFWQQGLDDFEESYNTNRIMDPGSIADIYLNDENEYRPIDGFRPHELPFFEVNAFSHLFINIAPSTPTFVIDEMGKPIAKGFSEFMSYLYHNAKYWLQSHE